MLQEFEYEYGRKKKKTINLDVGDEIEAADHFSKP